MTTRSPTKRFAYSRATAGAISITGSLSVCAGTTARRTGGTSGPPEPAVSPGERAGGAGRVGRFCGAPAVGRTSGDTLAAGRPTVGAGEGSSRRGAAVATGSGGAFGKDPAPDRFQRMSAPIARARRTPAADPTLRRVDLRRETSTAAGAGADWVAEGSRTRGREAESGPRGRVRAEIAGSVAAGGGSERTRGVVVPADSLPPARAGGGGGSS